MAKRKRKATRSKTKSKGLGAGIRMFKVQKQELGYVKPPVSK